MESLYPRLLDEACVSEKLDAQLAANAKHFFSDESNFRYDSRQKQFHLSAILNWFKDDFGSDQTARLKAIAPYLPDEVSRRAALANDGTVKYQKYDWGMNEQTRTARRTSP